MPVFPGTKPPQLIPVHTVASSGFAEKLLSMYSHTGTHMDAPSHMLDQGRTLDTYPVSYFYGKALLADFSGETLTHIDLQHLEPYKLYLPQVDYLILRTGWAAYWGQSAYFANFPALTLEAAHYVVSLGIKGVGTDAISIDCMGDMDFPIHKCLLGAETVIIENLTNLDKVHTQFQLACFPLPIAEADGAPVRAVAFT
jgi:arylformamidase